MVFGDMKKPEAKGRGAVELRLMWNHSISQSPLRELQLLSPAIYLDVSSRQELVGRWQT